MLRRQPGRGGHVGADVEQPAGRPLHYDPVAEQLSARIPLTDRAVIAKLTAVRDLHPAEQQAVQDLYFAPAPCWPGSRCCSPTSPRPSTR